MKELKTISNFVSINLKFPCLFLLKNKPPLQL